MLPAPGFIPAGGVGHETPASGNGERVVLAMRKTNPVDLGRAAEDHRDHLAVDDQFTIMLALPPATKRLVIGGGGGRVTEHKIDEFDRRELVAVETGQDVEDGWSHEVNQGVDTIRAVEVSLVVA